MKTAKDIMTKQVTTVSPDETVDKAIHKMATKGITGLPVVNAENELIGMITHYDIAEHEKNPHPPTAISLIGGMIYLENTAEYNEELKKILAQKAEDLMTTDVIAVLEDATLEEVISIMQEHEKSRIPVVDEDHHLKGIITRTDVVKALD